MNWKSFLMGLTTLLVANVVSAQDNLLNAKTPNEIGKVSNKVLADAMDKPLEYGYVDNRDILWSKIVWEYIDLNERINLPLYYPIDTNNVESTRRSLFHTLLKGVKSGKIKEVYDDSFFTSRLTMKEINAKLLRVDTADGGMTALNEGATDISEYVDSTFIKAQDIEGYRVKGIWYFDKRQGELKYRLLAMAPMAPDVQTLGRDDVEDDELLPLFWVFYPNARQVLYDMKVFNEKNSAYPISFDHILNARRFNSIIYREENIYGNRNVSDYMRGNALFQMLESDRLKESIRDKELDMWNY